MCVYMSVLDSLAARMYISQDYYMRCNISPAIIIDMAGGRLNAPTSHFLHSLFHQYIVIHIVYSSCHVHINASSRDTHIYVPDAVTQLQLVLILFSYSRKIDKKCFFFWILIYLKRNFTVKIFWYFASRIIYI